MRRAFSVAALVGLLGTLWFATPGGNADATTAEPTSTVEPTTTVAPTTTASIAPAARGTMVQVVPTEPPPTTVPAPSLDDAPANSGMGRRVVYSKGLMRVWIIDGDNSVVRTYRVSGRLDQPAYGTFAVFSRSAYTCSITHPNVCMRWMVRFARGPRGDNIGFHEIPRNNGVPVQSDAQLGLPLSGGCVRQSTADAWFMWNWAGIGTEVVVIR